MRIIDIINKVANGEEVPRFIIDDDEYYLGTDGYIKGIFGDYVEWTIDKEWLNEEVQIIEDIIEDKKIQKIEVDSMNRIKAESTGNFCYQVSQPTKIIIKKLNEIIDKMNEVNNE